MPNNSNMDSWKLIIIPCSWSVLLCVRFNNIHRFLSANAELICEKADTIFSVNCYLNCTGRRCRFSEQLFLRQRRNSQNKVWYFAADRANCWCTCSCKCSYFRRTTISCFITSTHFCCLGIFLTEMWRVSLPVWVSLQEET